MKVITIDSEAYKSLVRKIDRVYDFIKARTEREAEPAPDPGQVWITNGEAAALLEVSTRTLQRMRSAGEITYSIRGGRVWYTLEEIHRAMSGRVVASKYRQEGELLRAHQAYNESRRAAGTRKINKLK
ncbi:MAG: helix-turn-helix domain-containing protein [Alistipes sp.]|nr:helix-turn-helix domain-containing protein [Alistipes sp.]